MTSPALPALPGSSHLAGSGAAEPGVLDGLLDDGSAPAGVPIEASLSTHRTLLDGPHRDLLGPLVVPARDAAGLRDALTSSDMGLKILLDAGSARSQAGSVAAPPPGDPLDALRDARTALLDEDRVEVVGARLPLPPIDDPARAATALLAALDISVPAWITVPAGPQAAGALEILARDGAESITLDPGTGTGAELAGLLRRAVDLDLTFRATVPATAAAHGGRSGAGLVGDGHAPGALNLLCAVRAALNGAEEPDLERILAEQQPDPLLSAIRRMSPADGAVARAFLVGVSVPDAAAAVAELDGFGLLEG
jgi:hypothetical protein